MPPARIPDIPLNQGIIDNQGGVSAFSTLSSTLPRGGKGRNVALLFFEKQSVLLQNQGACGPTGVLRQN
jgi:hypothetical protein